MTRIFSIGGLCRAATTALVALGVCSVAVGQQVVITESGALSGTTAGTVTTFKGVPFAAPPVGDFRWRSPQPVAAWTGVREADHFAPACMQAIVGVHLPWTLEFQAAAPVSEDCLYLNVYMPAHPAHAHLPVLVWIHGGAFIVGASSPTAYHGETLARHGLVVVTVQYRLGVFGFMAHPELTAESPHHASGDYAIQDVAAALRWLQRNIAAFGGDPKRVTIAGQSSGAAMVEYQTATPIARGLFQRAITESAAWLNPPPAVPLAEAEKTGTDFASSVHVHTLAELRAMPAADLLAAQVKAQNQLKMKFWPDNDGWVLPETLGAIFTEGKQNDVATINGMVADEKSAQPWYGKTPEATFREQIQHTYGGMSDDLLRLYPITTNAELAESEKQIARDNNKVSMYLWAVNRAKTSKTPAYTYYFDRVIPWPEHSGFGAFHSSDIPYWMGTYSILDRPFTAADTRLSKDMQAYWTNFARTGSPNGKDVPTWPAVRAGRTTTMQLGEHIGPVPLMDAPKLGFWMKYYSTHAGDFE